MALIVPVLRLKENADVILTPQQRDYGIGSNNFKPRVQKLSKVIIDIEKAPKLGILV